MGQAPTVSTRVITGSPNLSAICVCVRVCVCVCSVGCKEGKIREVKSCYGYFFLIVKVATGLSKSALHGYGGISVVLGEHNLGAYCQPQQITLRHVSSSSVSVNGIDL